MVTRLSHLKQHGHEASEGLAGLAEVSGFTIILGHGLNALRMKHIKAL